MAEAGAETVTRRFPSVPCSLRGTSARCDVPRRFPQHPLCTQPVRRRVWRPFGRSWNDDFRDSPDQQNGRFLQGPCGPFSRACGRAVGGIGITGISLPSATPFIVLLALSALFARLGPATMAAVNESAGPQVSVLPLLCLMPAY